MISKTTTKKPRIKCRMTGRSGEQSLAVDCNEHLWALGRNQEGQLGNGIHGTSEKELTPVQVLDDMWYYGLLKPDITDNDYLLLRQTLVELLEQ